MVEHAGEAIRIAVSTATTSIEPGRGDPFPLDRMGPVVLAFIQEFIKSVKELGFSTFFKERLVFKRTLR